MIDFAFWKEVEKQHGRNVRYFKHEFDSSLTRLIIHRNGWTKFELLGNPRIIRERKTRLSDVRY